MMGLDLTPADRTDFHDLAKDRAVKHAKAELHQRLNGIERNTAAAPGDADYGLDMCPRLAAVVEKKGWCKSLVEKATAERKFELRLFCEHVGEHHEMSSAVQFTEANAAVKMAPAILKHGTKVLTYLGYVAQAAGAVTLIAPSVGIGGAVVGAVGKLDAMLQKVELAAKAQKALGVFNEAHQTIAEWARFDSTRTVANSMGELMKIMDAGELSSLAQILQGETLGLIRVTRLGAAGAGKRWVCPEHAMDPTVYAQKGE
jgi:hypothetical protein